MTNKSIKSLFVSFICLIVNILTRVLQLALVPIFSSVLLIEPATVIGSDRIGVISLALTHWPIPIIHIPTCVPILTPDLV